MNLKTRLSELSGAALVAVLLGCSMSFLLLDALSVPFLPGRVVLCCALTALFCGMVLLGRISAFFSAVALGGGIAFLAVKDVHLVALLRETMTAVLNTILSGEGSLSEHATVILIVLGIILTLAAFFLSRLNGGVYPAILMFMLVMMGSWFVEKRLVIAYTSPGLIALVVLYARAHRDRMNYLKAFPAALAAVLIDRKSVV